MTAQQHRRMLLRAIDDGAFNETLKWLLDNGLVVFVLTHDSVEFRPTRKGRLWQSSAGVFHPSDGGVSA